MTDSQLFYWAEALKCKLTLEAKVGSMIKTGTIYDAKDMSAWVKSMESEEFGYWLVTAENSKLTRRCRSFVYSKHDWLKLAESCLQSFERG